MRAAFSKTLFGSLRPVGVRHAASGTIDPEPAPSPDEDSTVTKQFINPPGLNPTVGFTHVVTATGGKTVHVSGQASVDAKGGVVGKGDFRAQVERTFENLKTALAAAGAAFADAVKVTYFVVGLKPEHVPVVREVRGRYLDRENPPASTLVGVAALAVPDWLIEVEVVAVVAD
jgi:enamine deaminase RidA (YjgF/YER057c/UK114 family)